MGTGSRDKKSRDNSKEKVSRKRNNKKEDEKEPEPKSPINKSKSRKNKSEAEEKPKKRPVSNKSKEKFSRRRGSSDAEREKQPECEGNVPARKSKSKDNNKPEQLNMTTIMCPTVFENVHSPAVCNQTPVEMKWTTPVDSPDREGIPAPTTTVAVSPAASPAVSPAVSPAMSPAVSPVPSCSMIQSAYIPENNAGRPLVLEDAKPSYPAYPPSASKGSSPCTYGGIAPSPPP